MGLIQTPSADSRPEGSIALTINKNDIWKFGTLTVSPFDWMEASYFYYRPSDLIWEGNSKRGHYLDKGFNVKFIYRPKNINVPNIAIGLDDFAGTGYFTREYVVATSMQSNIKYSLGIGWGKYAGNSSFKNPLSEISSSLLSRPLFSDNYNLGGSLSYDQWFRGNASIFGGLEWKFRNINGLKLKLEYDPFNYLDFSAQNRLDAVYKIRKKDSDINFGLSYALNKHLTIDASYIKGNTFNISFNMGITFNDSLVSKPKFKPVVMKQEETTKEKSIFYENLLFNLNNNSLFLQTSTLHKNGNLDIAISSSDYRNAVRSSSYAAYISKEVADLNDIDLSLINVAHVNAGIELNNITYIARHLSSENNVPIELKIRNSNLDSGNTNEFLEAEFKPRINFPVIFSSLSPSVVSHVGNPEKFYFGGLNLQYISEVQFNRNLLLSTELSLPLYHNFQDTISGPGSAMRHVRSDLVQYLKEDDIHIKRMQLDYIWTPYKDIYAKISGGIFEPMFGGFGGELLYKPFDKNYNFGLELFYVNQRSFDQRFNFQDYETVTGHITFGYQFAAGVETNLSFGRYLAKDDGYTFDIGRRTKSGFKAGVYFSRTNVSAELFGEGSFDKGFYFQIPLDLFNNEYNGNYSTFKLSPLTRDGGAKLIHDKDLRGLIYNSSYYELKKQWDGFLN